MLPTCFPVMSKMRLACAARQVFEKGNFAGVDAMKKSEKLFNRIAPMGVADITMAVQYRHVARSPLRGVPLTAFDGVLDATIARGNMARWGAFTDGAFRILPVAGDHYFVTTRYREARHMSSCSRAHCDVVVGLIATDGQIDIALPQQHGPLRWLQTSASCCPRPPSCDCTLLETSEVLIIHSLSGGM